MPAAPCSWPTTFLARGRRRECEDVAAVAADLAAGAGEPVDVFGHSIGGVVVLGAAAIGAPLRRLALYEPPGPPAVNAGWLSRLRALMAAGTPGPAVASFLVEVVGLTREEVLALRDAPPGPDDVLAVASRTLVGEGEALAAVDLANLAGRVRQPVLLMCGPAGPAWAAQTVGALAEALPQAEVVELAGEGHEGVDTAAAAVAGHLVRFFRPGGAVAVARASSGPEPPG